MPQRSGVSRRLLSAEVSRCAMLGLCPKERWRVSDQNVFDDSDKLSIEDILELEDEDGEVVKFALLAMVDVDGKQYAMTVPLLQLQSEDPSAQIDLHLLVYVEEGDETYYEDIEDEAEYARVHAFCTELMSF
jgi:hypothetical protein